MIERSGVAMVEKLLVSWSSGKDSALALCAIESLKRYEIKALLTTLSNESGRIGAHGLRRTLLERQAASCGYPLEMLFLPEGAANDQYEAALGKALEKKREQGISAIVYGDIYLEDIRDYREKHLERAGMKALFPLWHQDTSELAREFIDLGFKAVITSVDSRILDRRMLGRIFDRQFLSELPSGTDPCGENGEFHTFVFDGPIFRESIHFTVGEVFTENKHFLCCDLIPV
jgi:uncharacterized protein (TIGR00290 family)